MWAFRQRFFYIIIFLIILIIIFGIPIYRSLNKAPTCSDGKQNGTELGVDCGGVCEKVCSFTTEDPIVLWSRSVYVRGGLYNSLAMIENPNIGSGAVDVPYIFRLFDDENVLVYERKGKTNITPQARFPIFEGGIFVGERKPARTFFEFVGDIDWVQQPKQTSNIRVDEERIMEGPQPRIEATLSNKSPLPIRNIAVFVIVYDKEGNTMAGSETFVENILADSKKEITFTWPESFVSEVGRIEVIPKLGVK